MRHTLAGTGALPQHKAAWNDCGNKGPGTVLASSLDVACSLLFSELCPFWHSLLVLYMFNAMIPEMFQFEVHFVPDAHIKTAFQS